MVHIMWRGGVVSVWYQHKKLFTITYQNTMEANICQ